MVAMTAAFSLKFLLIRGNQTHFNRKVCAQVPNLTYSGDLRGRTAWKRPFFRLRHFTVVAFSMKLIEMRFDDSFANAAGKQPSIMSPRLGCDFPLLPVLLYSLLFSFATARASEFDTIGGTLLRQVAPTLLGSNVPVAQPEGYDNGIAGAFEVAPFVVGQPTNLFTWISSNGVANTFPNSVGSISAHADSVAGNFYGNGSGVAPQVSHVDNYDADYFFNQFIANSQPISGRVVNQSFIFANGDGSHLSASEEQSINSSYDDYAAQYGVLIVSGAGNGGTVYPSATSYNGIGVGVYPGSSSVGPTPDGRSKPDLVSPGSGATSFSTPYVSGAAAVLIQGAARGDGGADTNSASDLRTLKSLLLNGAIKPPGWTNGTTTPLDARYGAGALNVFNAWNQLRGGKHPFIEATTVANGSAHPPGANTGNEPVLTGWDLNSLTNPLGLSDRINHYYFNLPGSNSFTLTATLTWLRPHSTLLGPSGINDLNLFLYNTASGQLVLSSTSAVDNVEHIYIPALPPGRYDLQVLKNAQSQVSPDETYALAFEFFNVSMSVRQTNGNAIIQWPIAPTGFELLSATNLGSSLVWSTVTAPATVDTNANQNVVTVPITGGNQFFLLRRP